MIFNLSETSQLIAALETYDEEPRGLLKPELQHKLCESCLKKLNSQNIFTTFSKQEYSMMVYAIHFIITILDSRHYRGPDELYELHLRLLELATPEA